MTAYRKKRPLIVKSDRSSQKTTNCRIFDTVSCLEIDIFYLTLKGINVDILSGSRKTFKRVGKIY